MKYNNLLLHEPPTPADCSLTSLASQAGSRVLTGSFGTILLQQVTGTGLTLTHYHCFIDKACDVHGIINEPHPFLCVNLKRTVLLDFYNEQPHTLYEWACNCLYEPAASGAVVFRKPGQYAFFTIHFDINNMEAFIKTHPRGAAFIQQVRANLPAVLSRDNFPALKTMRHLIADILYWDVSNDYHTAWLDIKLRELMLPFITGSDKDKNTGQAVNEREAEAIYIIKDKLLSELHHTPLLEELAACCGLSEYKLKTGFRKIYGMSWIDFLHEARMKKAYDLVGYTRLPYYEIADRVGYQSLPTFINKFRENVGLSPKRFRDGFQGEHKAQEPRYKR